MQHFLSQFSVKDLVTYLLMAMGAYYSLVGGQRDKDSKQDERLALIEQNQSQLLPALKDNQQTLLKVQLELEAQKVRWEELSKKIK